MYQLKLITMTCEFLVMRQDVQEEETTIRYSLGHAVDTVLDWKVQVQPATVPFRLLTVREDHDNLVITVVLVTYETAFDVRVSLLLD